MNVSDTDESKEDTTFYGLPEDPDEAARSGPPGATVEVRAEHKDGEVIAQGQTPYRTSLSRAETLYAHFSRNGYPPKTALMESGVNHTTKWNIPFTLGTGLFVDLLTGAYYEYNSLKPLPLEKGPGEPDEEVGAELSITLD